jgi:hypothetical protein
MASAALAARRPRSFWFLLQAVTSCGEFLAVTARAYAKVHSTPPRLQICLIRHIITDMSRPAANKQPKPLRWVGSSKEDLSAFPEDVKDRVGEALGQAQWAKRRPMHSP